MIHIDVVCLQGFYTVYSTVFQKLAEEERQAAASQSHTDDIPFSAFPSFGNDYAAAQFIVSAPAQQDPKMLPVCSKFIVNSHAYPEYTQDSNCKPILSPTCTAADVAVLHTHLFSASQFGDIGPNYNRWMLNPPGACL